MFITAFHLAVLSTAILWTCMLITLFLPCSRVLLTHSLLVHFPHLGGFNFWYKIWEKAGCPNAGVLFQIKKRRYKYEVRRLVCRQKYLLQNKLATSFAEKRKNSFWTHVRKLNSSSSTLAPTIDGVSGSRKLVISCQRVACW